MASLALAGGSLTAAIQTLNTPRTFPAIETLSAWTNRAEHIREHILVHSGLWPMPSRGPMNVIRKEVAVHDDYRVESVLLETYPGFWLGGNLYRPRTRTPCPGVLNPHGHWPEGRLVDNEVGSIAARCIHFAREGMVAFSYDMVGFNDTRFRDSPTNLPFYDLHRSFATNRADQLWNISLMGLQTWNSLRALDFLRSLPEVDTNRMACTGESGGGTQTFMLGAIESSLACQAPVVMVSHTMQGGCSCENTPGLRVQFSNMEISAAAAPRPQILVAATGDWTRDTLEVEGPSIRKIYDLYGRRDDLSYVRFEGPHNYNQKSREAVYAWFDRWLAPANRAAKEQPYHKENNDVLRCVPDREVARGMLTQDEFVQNLKEDHRQRWDRQRPRNLTELEGFKRTFKTAWAVTLQLDGLAAKPKVTLLAAPGGQMVQIQTETGMVEGTFRKAASSKTARVTVILASSGGATENRSKLADELTGHGFNVLSVDSFSNEQTPDPFANFFTTYNRTRAQERVADLIAVASAVATQIAPGSRSILWGQGFAGAWAILAVPALDGVIADFNHLDDTKDQNLLDPNYFCPGVRDLGTFEGPLLLSLPKPVMVYNLPKEGSLRRTFYSTLTESKRLALLENMPSTKEIISWLKALPKDY